MAQILDPLPPNSSDRILCCYVNATSKVQVVRITNVPGWYFERVVFPGQRLIFETMSEALLEIHSGMMASAILSDKIPCDRLRVEEQPQVSSEASQKVAENIAFHQKSEKTNKTLDKTASLTSPVLVAVD